jgi:hypothetical protein
MFALTGAGQSLGLDHVLKFAPRSRAAQIYALVS